MKYFSLLLILMIIAALTNCKQLHAYELSIVTGLHVKHYAAQNYKDYRKPKTVCTGTCNWATQRTVYENKKLNEGSFNNNQLIGLRIKSGHYTANLITYNNSFYERTNGLGFTYTKPIDHTLSIEAGAFLLDGYRPIYLRGSNENTNPNKQLIVSPIVGLNWKATTTTTLTYSLMYDVGLLSLTQRIDMF